MRRVILVGPGTSGKTTLAKRMAERGGKIAVSYTTRPMREGEVNGKDYNFIPEEAFLSLLERNRFLEWAEFNGWKYGTALQSWDYYDVFIMTPTGLAQLSPIMRAEAFVIYLNPPRHVLRDRLAKRLDADSAARRRAADIQDFTGFIDFDMEVTTACF